MPSTYIVVPCYNEARRLDAHAFQRQIDRDSRVAFCFVDDGSTDETARRVEVLARANPERVELIRLPGNVGKAEAVRRGVLAGLRRSDCHVVGFFDADLATPLDQLEILIDEMHDRPTAAMVFGSRVKLLGRDVRRWALRHYTGRLFATAVSLILGLGVYDTQCGAKLLRSDVAAEVFQESFVGRWVFDVEIFARLVALLGYDRANRDLIEVPLETWTDKGDSRITATDLVGIPLQLVAILVRYRRDLATNRRPGPVAPANGR